MASWTFLPGATFAPFARHMQLYFILLAAILTETAHDRDRGLYYGYTRHML